MGKLADYIVLYTVISGMLYMFNDGSEEVCSDNSPSVIYNTQIEAEEDISDEHIPLTDDEIDIIALVTMAEAEGETEKGKRLVIDTILNRVDSEYFPDTVEEVVYQPYQFSCMWNGRAERCKATDEIYGFVTEELENRTDDSVIFFRASRYSEYGEPLFKEGSHYFSGYN